MQCSAVEGTTPGLTGHIGYEVGYGMVTSTRDEVLVRSTVSRITIILGPHMHAPGKRLVLPYEDTPPRHRR